MNTRDTLIDWLQHTFALEKTLEQRLSKQARNEDLPGPFRERVCAHLADVRLHASTVKRCLHLLNAEPPLIKNNQLSGMSSLIGETKHVSFSVDDTVNELLKTSAAEHNKMSCYKTVRALALWLGEEEIATACEMILEDELMMTNWLDDHLADMVLGHLHESSRGASVAVTSSTIF